MKIYSKNNLIKLISSMNSSGRFAHSILLTGEKGSGRKTSAKFTAQSLLCENLSDGLPCGVCRSCKRTENGTHPDVIYPETEGKSDIYSAAKTRETAADCFTLPNDGERKIYIFKDCEKLPPISQNTLLKIIEEPPPYLYFIFTAYDKSAFLPTVLSRVISAEISECTEEECKEALLSMGGFSEEEINRAVSAYHGNIGKCREYMERGGAYEICEKAKSITNALISSDRYTVLKELSEVSGRENMKEILNMLDKIIRDALYIGIAGDGAKLVGCAGEAAKKLSPRITKKRGHKIHLMLSEAINLCGGGININQNALCCKVSGGLF